MLANLENSAVTIGLEKISFHSTPKEGQFQRMFNVLYSWAHVLVRLCSKSFKLSFSSAWTENFQMYKLDLEMAGELEIRLPTFVASLRKQENSRKNIYFCFIDYTKAFDNVDHNKLWKVLKKMGIADHLTCSLRNLHVSQ